MTQPSARAVQELHPRLGRKKFHQVLGGYVLLFFLFSFYGWLLETAHFVIRWGKLTDRGFLSLPLCPIYGFFAAGGGAGAGVTAQRHAPPAVRTGKAPAPRAARGAAYGGLLLLYYVFASALPAGAELAVGAFCDKLLGIRLWDYSYKGNDLFGYITLDRTLVWGVLLALVLTIVWEPLRETFCSFAPAAKTPRGRVRRRARRAHASSITHSTLSGSRRRERISFSSTPSISEPVRRAARRIARARRRMQTFSKTYRRYGSEALFQAPADAAEKAAVAPRRVVQSARALGDIRRQHAEGALPFRTAPALPQKHAVLLRQHAEEGHFQKPRDLVRGEHLAVRDHVPAHLMFTTSSTLLSR